MLDGLLQDIADPTVQILALTKFGSTLMVAYALAGNKGPQPERAPMSRQCQVLTCKEWQIPFRFQPFSQSGKDRADLVGLW